MTIIWVALIALIVLLLYFDLVVLHKKGEVTHKRTAYETIFWVSVALAFTGVIYLLYDNNLVNNPTQLTAKGAALKYLTGYLVELSLSVDNLFVIAMIFKSQKIPLKYQHKTLFYGILGAIFFRGLMIAIGVVLINKLDWMPYVFGVFLIFTGLKMLYDELKHKKIAEDPEIKESFANRTMRKYVSFTKTLHGDKFFIREHGKLLATPLFAALVLIELTDLLFAVDSIPAILGITKDAFLVFNATIFATLGLRAMYFFLANMLEKFHYLKYSVFVILLYIGMKLILMHHIEIPEWFSLSVIFVSLMAGLLVSWYNIRKAENITPTT
ncbi:MAG: TerC/Alx family metal homeostasis membrane protein [Weeksellaceae bacterium]|nr:TerC/Alx family metal homeostasis membrane protein [Weeksellaceae bacterium]